MRDELGVDCPDATPCRRHISDYRRESERQSFDTRPGHRPAVRTVRPLLLRQTIETELIEHRISHTKTRVKRIIRKVRKITSFLLAGAARGMPRRHRFLAGNRYTGYVYALLRRLQVHPLEARADISHAQGAGANRMIKD